MIHQRMRMLLEGAPDVFECSGTARKAEVDAATVKAPHAKIEELAVANDYLSARLKAWTGK